MTILIKEFMKKILLTLLLLPSLIIAQELSPSLGITLVNFTFENEFDIPFSNTEIKLVQSNNRYYSIITDSIGKCSILLNQGNSFRIICVVNGSEYEFDNQIEIHKKESLFTLNMDLTLELYSEIIELSKRQFKKYSRREHNILWNTLKMQHTNDNKIYLSYDMRHSTTNKKSGEEKNYSLRLFVKLETKPLRIYSIYEVYTNN